ncbi:hypothetical protein D3C71_1976530 [compost metagenome]
MQAVLRQRRLDQLYRVTHLLRFALQVVARHVLVLHRQVDPAGREHAHGRREVAHRHLVQPCVAIEVG